LTQKLKKATIVAERYFSKKIKKCAKSSPVRGCFFVKIFSGGTCSIQVLFFLKTFCRKER